MRKPLDRLAVFLREMPKEVVDQQRKIRASLAQRWNENRDVDLDRTAGAYLVVFSLLKHAQELRLQVQGKVTDFVEEESSPVSQLKAPLARSYGAGESAFFMAEQFRFEKCFGKRRAVYLN